MNNFEATLLFSPDLTAKKIESIEKLFEKQVTINGWFIGSKRKLGFKRFKL